MMRTLFLALLLLVPLSACSSSSTGQKAEPHSPDAANHSDTEGHEAGMPRSGDHAMSGEAGHDRAADHGHEAGAEPGHEAAPEHGHQDGDHHAASGDWCCPMHPQHCADEKGRCPECNMFFVQGAGESPADQAQGDGAEGQPASAPK